MTCSMFLLDKNYYKKVIGESPFLCCCIHNFEEQSPIKIRLKCQKEYTFEPIKNMYLCPEITVLVSLCVVPY